MIVIPVDIILGTPIEPILAFLPAARVLVPRAGLAFVWVFVDLFTLGHFLY
jgi:hypothetical protein